MGNRNAIIYRQSTNESYVMPKTNQVWQCPVCKWTHQPAIPVLAIGCGKPHSTKTACLLIEGDPIEPRKPKASKPKAKPVEHPPPAPVKSVRSRPKAGLITSGDDLLKAMGLK